MAMLKTGDSIVCGRQRILIKKLISDMGATAEIYRVEIGGRTKALKWFKPEFKTNEYVLRVRQLIRERAPDETFVWPEVFVEDKTHFGYLMELVPGRFKTLNVINNSDKIKFKSFRVMCDAALTTVKSFGVLNPRAMVFKDISSRNVMIDPDTGEVKIIDVDNISASSENKGIDGTPKYISPEVLAGAPPTKYSDLLALETVVFEIFFNNHPLHGRRYFQTKCFTPEYSKLLYQTDPLFIFDSKNNDNRPMKAQQAVTNIWNEMPDHMKALFRKAFSREAYFVPTSRVSEDELFRHLMQFRNELVTCPRCGEEIAVNNGTAVCTGCRSGIRFSRSIKLGDTTLPLHKGTRVYLAQTSRAVAPADRLRLFGRAVTDQSTGRYGFINLSGSEMTATAPNGARGVIKPNGVVPYAKGIKLHIGARQIASFE